MKPALILLSSFIFLLALAFLPLPIPPYLDFQVIYHANLGLLRGIPIYDHAGQVNMIAQFANVSPDQVYVLPFPYPPWYALSTLWLAWLPIEVAARVWLGLNLIMLFFSVWLITDGWIPVKRLLSFLFAVLFLPVLGSLFVGQYSFPVLVGAASLIYALRRDQAILTAISAALLTFKPHLGGLIVLVALVYLWLRKDGFGQRALTAIMIGGALLFAVGFLASPLWPLDYLHSLAGFKDVSQCHQCNSISMELAGLLGRGLDQAIWFSTALLMFAVVWLVRQWRRLARRTDWLVSAGVLVTLFASPYLQNYDYVLLLIPLLVLAGDARPLDWPWLTLAYFLPLAGLVLFGSAGAAALILSALNLFIFLGRRLFQSGELSPT